MHRSAKKRRPGFTLIEFLVYVALLSWLSYMASHLMISFVAAVRDGARLATAQAQALLAFDLLVRDLRSAPATIHAWKKITADTGCSELIWASEQGGDIGWAVEKGKLMRTTGNYRSQDKQWHSRRRVVATESIQKFCVSLQKENDHVVAVSCTVEIDTVITHTVEQLVVLRKGTVVCRT
jgi:type II secretory pathway pseudopilin PulG